MQVLQWLFRAAHDQKPANDNFHHHIKKNEYFKEDEKLEKLVGYKEKRASKKGGKKAEETGLDYKKFRYLALLIKRRNSRTFFNKSLDHQKRLSGRLNHRQKLQQKYYYITSMKMSKDDLVRGRIDIAHNNKQDSSAHVGNKVLPITDSSITSSSSSSMIDDHDQKKQCGPLDAKIIKDTKVKGKGNNNNKTKTLSRMKELLRWAASAKSQKGGKFGRKVLHFRNRSATMKSGAYEEESSYDSPKISFRWEVESGSTTYSAVSAPPCLKYDDPSCARKSGNWITTDDEFVVLEL